MDKDYKTGKREGTNADGLHWKEEWAVNEKTGHQRWSKMTHEPKHLRNDGFDAKWGEWREVFPGKEANGEKWTEMLKEEDDYWERRSEKYNDFPKPIVNDIQNAFDELIGEGGPLLVRSGVQEFRNNRQFMVVEHFEEFIDGTLIKKIVEDDSYGKKILEKRGMKLNLDKIENIEMYTDQNGYFKHYQDGENLKYHSLQELIDANKKFLEWEYTNSTIDLIGQHKTISIKKGVDYQSAQDWHFEKHFNTQDKSEVVKNRAKDLDGEWKETWTKKLRERWAHKEGYRNNADGNKTNEWTEKWYKKVKHRKAK